MLLSVGIVSVYYEPVGCSIQDKYFPANLGENIVINLSIGRSNDASPNQIHNQGDELKQMSNKLCLERGDQTQERT